MGPLKSYLCANGTHSHRLPPGLAVLAPCKMSKSHGCNNMTRQKSVQSDRWVEGHDPELFNLRRKTSKDDALNSILLPPQNAGSGRSAPDPKLPCLLRRSCHLTFLIKAHPVR